MSKLLNLAIFSATILSLITLGYSVKCFQCNSAVNPDCAGLATNSTNSEYYKECLGNYNGEKPFCRIYATEVAHEKDKIKALRVYRSCGWIKDKELPEIEKCTKSDTDFIKKTQCVCYKDACNESPYLRSSYILISVFFVIHFLHY